MEAIFSTIPMHSPPRMAPGRYPNPPMTPAANPLSPIMLDMVVVIFSSGDTKSPIRQHIIILIMTVTVMTVLTSIPISWAAFRFCATHRMAFPGFVLYKKSCSASTQNAAAAIIAILAMEMTTSPAFTVPIRKPGTENGTGPHSRRMASTMIFPSMTVAIMVYIMVIFLSGMKMTLATTIPRRATVIRLSRIPGMKSIPRPRI